MQSSSHEVILTSSPDGPIIAYDASSGAAVTRFTSSRSPRRGLALVGNIFIAASHISPVTASGSIHLYNWWSSTAFHNFPVPEAVAPLTATPDGSYLFAGGLSGCVYALSVPSGDIFRSLHVHNKSVSCLRISEDSSLLISGSDDGTITAMPIFQLVGSENQDMDQLILHKFAAHSGAVTDIASGKALCDSQIISCSLDCTCKFWSLLRRTHLCTVAFPSAILGLVLSPSESVFYAAGSDGSVYKGSIKVGNRKFIGKGEQEPVRWAQNHNNGEIVSLAMVNHGRNLVSASEDGNVWIWKADEGQVVLTLGSEFGRSISDLVVATGINCGKELVTSLSKSDGVNSVGLCQREVIMSSLPVKEMVEMEDVLCEAEKDRSRAVDMLESAIAMYERLLELILKEAKRANNTTSCSSSRATKERENYIED